MPAVGRPEPEGTGDEGTGIEARLAALERLLAAMTAEITTRRLVVVDRLGRPRLVAEVSQDTAELRVQLPDDHPGQSAGPGDPVRTVGRTAAVLYATPAGGGSGADDLGLGPAIGLQLWADGDAIAETDAWPDDCGRWQAHQHLAGDP